MAKLDLKSAYRQVPVHPDDQGLLAVKWNGKIFLDLALAEVGSKDLHSHGGWLVMVHGMPWLFELHPL